MKPRTAIYEPVESAQQEVKPPSLSVRTGSRPNPASQIRSGSMNSDQPILDHPQNGSSVAALPMRGCHQDRFKSKIGTAPPLERSVLQPVRLPLATLAPSGRAAETGTQGVSVIVVGG